MPHPLTRRRFISHAAGLAALSGAGATAVAARHEHALRRDPCADTGDRITLDRPGPMLPPVPAVILSVPGEPLPPLHARGDVVDDRPAPPDELSVVWSFVINGEPPQIGVAIADEHVAQRLVATHKQFVLNVPVASIVERFDRVDMNSSHVGDKYELSGLTRGEAIAIDAPTVVECPIHLECRVLDSLRVEPMRQVFIAEVVATTVAAGVVDDHERLIVEDVPLFGMTAGSGEFYTMGDAIGHIGQTVGRDDIRY